MYRAFPGPVGCHPPQTPETSARGGADRGGCCISCQLMLSRSQSEGAPAPGCRVAATGAPGRARGRLGRRVSVGGCAEQAREQLVQMCDPGEWGSLLSGQRDWRSRGGNGSPLNARLGIRGWAAVSKEGWCSVPCPPLRGLPCGSLRLPPLPCPSVPSLQPRVGPVLGRLPQQGCHRLPFHATRGPLRCGPPVPPPVRGQLHFL